MSGGPGSKGDGPTDEPPPARPPRDDHPADDLRTVVVRYADRPDECTIRPCERTIEVLLSTYITVDRDAVVDLDDAR